MGEPPVEFGRSKMRVLTWNERLIAEFDAEVGRLRIHNDLPGVLVILENPADDLINAERIGAGNLNRAVYRLGESCLGDRSRDIFRSDRLEQRV